MIPLLLADGSLGAQSVATVQISLTIPERFEQTDNPEPELESVNGETELVTRKYTLSNGVEVYIYEPK